MMSRLEPENYLYPDWAVPPQVKAVVTTRGTPPFSDSYATFNLAQHVGDDCSGVQRNRLQLCQELDLPQQPVWLNQVHGNQCISLDSGSFVSDNNSKIKYAADASATRQPGVVCCVMTADCLPILFCNRAGSWVAACHAGWRGLLSGVVENTIASYYPAVGDVNNHADLMAWIGPAISQPYFEVGVEVRQAFIDKNRDFNGYFDKNEKGRYQFDLTGLARQIMQQLGISVSGGNHCSFSQRISHSNQQTIHSNQQATQSIHDDYQFYSYRREGETGRMASLIWLDKGADAC